MIRMRPKQALRHIVTSSVPLIPLVLALLVHFVLLAPVQAQTPNVTISNGTTAVAIPGETVTFNHTVTNNSATQQTVTLTATSASGYSTTINPGTMTLNAGASQQLSVTVAVPSDASVGSDVTTVRVLQGTTELDTATDTTQVILLAVDVTAPAGGSAEPGDVKAYTFTIKNLSSQSETFILSASSSNSFPVALSLTSVTLSANASQNVTVSISISASTTATSDTTTFKATSVLRSTVFDDETVTTTIDQGGGDDQIYADVYEPNNSLATATEIVPSTTGASRCDNTLWPVGDIDYFTYFGKAGKAYRLTTESLSIGIDTYMTAYDRYGNVIATNDDYLTTGRASQITLSIGADGYYFVSIVNLDPTDPADRTYCIKITEVEATATPTPAPTLVPDTLEPNGSFDTAALIEVDVAYSLDFVPPIPPGPDNDFFRIWVKPNILYTCGTSNLSGVNDTNMILYDQNRNGLAGNDDKAPGDLGSEVSYLSTYTGWLYILVGPYATPAYDQSELYTYTLLCEAVAATPTPTPTNTPTPAPFGGGGSGGGVFIPTATPQPTATPEPTKDADALVPTPVPTPRPIVSFQPLPTATPLVSTVPQFAVEVTLYYDANNNFLPELNEGIMDIGVALYDNATGQLLSFGYTNQAGRVTFEPIVAQGAVRVVVPFLNFSQTVTADTSNVTLRVAPQQLPGQIP